MLFLEGIPMRESFHDQARKQSWATAIIFLRNAHGKQFRRGQGAPVFVEGGACATAQWHNGQSKPAAQYAPAS